MSMMLKRTVLMVCMAELLAPKVQAGRVSFTRLFLRVLVCSFAFLVGAIAAGLVGTFALYRGLEGDAAYEVAFISTAFFGTLLVAHAALLPFLVLIILTEAFRMRALLLFMASGALIALYQLNAHLQSSLSVEDNRVLVAAAAGAVGGFVYWLVAGRKAGDYREPLYEG